MPSSHLHLASVELCAGAGGQAIGLHQAGFRHVALVENDRHAAETLRHNGKRTRWWPASAVYEASVKGWDPPAGIGAVDLLAGGVPCPPFSVAGKQLGPDDERDLFPAVLELAVRLEPRVIMIENVRGLLGCKFEAYRAAIISELNSMGYEAEWELLEAHEFGVPQLRPRSVLVAARPEVFKFFKWPTPGEVPARSVGETLLPLMEAEGWRGARAWAQRADTIAPTLVGGSKKHGGADLGPTRAKRHWREVLGVDALTLANEPPAAGFLGNPKLTLTMAAALQGFPSSWAFSGGKTAAYRQVGNAFPPPVARAVGGQIKAALVAAEAT